MSSKKPIAELPVDKLRYRCSADVFEFETTKELDCSFDIIGQDRAIKAIRLGLSVRSRGYNILVQGLTGTGKETTVKSILEKVAHNSTIPGDICYVFNFDDADRPNVLYLPPGDGTRLRKDMNGLVDYLSRTVPAVLESDEFKKRRTQIIEHEGEKGRGVIQEFEGRIKKENFVLVELRFGPVTKNEVAPIVEEKLRTGDELETSSKESMLSGSDSRRSPKVSSSTRGTRNVRFWRQPRRSSTDSARIF